MKDLARTDEREIEELQELEAALPKDLPPVSPELVQIARMMLKLEEFQNADGETTLDSTMAELKCHEMLSEKGEKMAEELEKDHRELSSMLEGMLAIQGRLAGYLS
jgi:hypothetical protein